MPALSYLIVCGALGFVDRLRTGATAKWMAAASCLVVAGGLTAWVVADLRMDCQDYRAGLTMERSITRRFVAGEDSDIFAYYLPGVRRIRFGELSRELADNSPMQVAYHDYYNGREDEAMAEKLSRVCDSRRRHWVVMFTCNSRSGTTGTEKPIGDVSLD
jgi:hypothetical protein